MAKRQIPVPAAKRNPVIHIAAKHFTELLRAATSDLRGIKIVETCPWILHNHIPYNELCSLHSPIIFSPQTKKYKRNECGIFIRLLQPASVSLQCVTFPFLLKPDLTGLLQSDDR